MTDDLDLIPYSVRRRRPDLEMKLPQERSPDEDINAVVEEFLRAEQRNPPVNLGFADRKGNRHG